MSGLTSPTGSVSRVNDVITHLILSLAAIQTGAGYHFDVKATSIVGDPVSVLTTPTTDVPIIVLGDADLDITDFQPARRIKETFTVNLYMRADVIVPDSSAKLDLWTQMVADVETALVGTDALAQRGGLALDTKLGRAKQLSPSLNPNNSMVFLERAITVLMQPRTYGQPTSQG